MIRIALFLCGVGLICFCARLFLAPNEDNTLRAETEQLRPTEQPTSAQTLPAVKEPSPGRPDSNGGNIGTAATALAEAAQVEIARGHIYPLPEGEAIDSSQYMAPFQTLCFLSTVEGAWLVIVTKDEYPAVFDAFDSAKSSPMLEGCRSSPEDTTVTLTMRRTRSASLLVAPFPGGLPGLEYSFQLAPGSSDPVYARDSTDQMVHQEPKGLAPVGSAWSFRTFAFRPGDDWQLDLGQGEGPPAFSIQVRPN